MENQLKFTYSAASTSTEFAAREFDYFVSALTGGSVVVEAYVIDGWETVTTLTATGSAKVSFCRTRRVRLRSTGGSGSVKCAGWV